MVATRVSKTPHKSLSRLILLLCVIIQNGGQGIIGTITTVVTWAQRTSSTWELVRNGRF